MNTAKEQSETYGKEYLRGRFVDIEKAFIEDLQQAQREVTHPGALGDTWEDAWIDLLRKYLPARYKVSKAFVVDHLGHTTDQLDCLIYDAHFTPALFGKDKHQYVPAEAVYATFEAKPSNMFQIVLLLYSYILFKFLKGGSGVHGLKNLLRTFKGYRIIRVCIQNQYR